jgi:hypothetical protein
MATSPEFFPRVPITPFSFSILITSPIHCNLPFTPVSSLILPLGRVRAPFTGLIIAGLDIFTTFLAKRCIIQRPDPCKFPPEMLPVTLNLAQLAELVQKASNGTLPDGSPTRQSNGPVGGDEPLSPDNLTFSLLLGTPFTEVDSPDTSYNVPLFEIPGVPGNLIIALVTVIAQFLIERSGTPGCKSISLQKGGGQ